jgi:hypothetical protein
MVYESLDAAYVWCSRIAGVAIALSSLEELSVLREFGHRGRYDLPDVAIGDSPRTVQSLNTGVEAFVAVIGVRLLFGLALVVAAEHKVWLTVSWLVVAASGFVVRWRHKYGGEDGGDQMLTIMSTTFAVCLTVGYLSSVVRAAGLYFVGAQACLAHTASGLAKLSGRDWRTGSAIRGILSTRTYGMRSLGSVTQKFPFVSLLLCWITIVFETAFLAAPVLPRIALLMLLLVAGLFHLSVAYAMGLNGFFWSFVATYPAILFLNEGFRHLL